MGQVFPVAAALCLLVFGAASAQVVTGSSSSGYVPLFVDGASAGNGADLTEDLIKTYTLPANTLVNIGDQIEITAGGTMGATTDVKQAFIRINGITGANLCAPAGNAASIIRWSSITRLVKTGATAMSSHCVGGSLNGSNNGTSSGTLNVTATAPTDIVVSGKNTTNSVAGSVTVQYFSVALIRAPGT